MSLINLKKKSYLEKTPLLLKEKSLQEKNILYKLEKTKHFPSSVREWNNSIYCFDSNNLDLVPSTSINVMSLIKSYFNFFQKKLERKMRSKRLLLRFRRLSLNKIFLSNGQFKHCNNKVLINLYIFNRQKNNLLNRLKKVYLSKKNKKLYFLFFIQSLKNIYPKGFYFLKQRDKSNFLLKKALNIIEKKAQYKIKNYQSLNYYSSFFYKKVLKLIMRKYRLFFLYKKLLFLNESKTNYTYLRILKKNLEIIYNKNVEFNLINLKRFYLNSDILSEALKTKITRKRGKLNKFLKKIKNKIKIQSKSFFTGFKKILEKEKKEMFVVNNLKYRHVTGFKLQASGRLTRRYTASRSLKRVRYAGNLLNIDSSYRAMSCALLKGNLKSNLQFSKLASKTRIGSFGLKGWVSGN